jgi:TetR/AcrR family transcriptional regulator, transcriptional repressor for nem operon
MPASPKYHNRVRELVLQGAHRLFNRRGFAAVSINDVMADAGLTRGSFYRYFSSKSDLYAHSVTRFIHEDHKTPKDYQSERAKAAKIVRDYLSMRETEQAGDSFPLICLSNQPSRTDRAVRRAHESALKAMAESFEQAATADPQARRTHGLAICALCVGGLILSRSLEDHKLADELREAAMTTAFDLGKW